MYWARRRRVPTQFSTDLHMTLYYPSYLLCKVFILTKGITWILRWTRLISVLDNTLKHSKVFYDNFIWPKFYFCFCYLFFLTLKKYSQTVLIDWQNCCAIFDYQGLIIYLSSFVIKDSVIVWPVKLIYLICVMLL